MKKNRDLRTVLFIIVFGLIIIVAPATLYADTQYVSDKLIITMRRGAGSDYMIIKTLKSGEALEILKEKDKYYKVKTSGGETGWVLKQYITPDTPKPIIVAGLSRKLKSLNATIEKLKNEKSTIKSDLTKEQGLHKKDATKLEKNLNKANDQIFRSNKKLKEVTRKYDILVKDSDNVVRIVGERDMFRKENKRLTSEVSTLKENNKSLSNRNIVFWFVAGGGVLLIGWLIGQISKKRKSGFH